jgi:hypothetical protein
MAVPPRVEDSTWTLGVDGGAGIRGRRGTGCGFAADESVRTPMLADRVVRTLAT